LDSLSIQTYQRFKTDLEKLEEESEKYVVPEEGRYQGLDLRALYTSFEDLETLFEHPEVGGVWVDLGGGSGRSCLLYSLLKRKPSINLEIDPSRASICSSLAQKYHLPVTSLVVDLLTDSIPEGDTYFLYFPTGMVLDRVLHVLSQRLGFTLVVIESHGDLIPRINKEEEYQLMDKLPLKTPRHYPYAHIYKKIKMGISENGPHKMSFRDELLVISDHDGEWVANSKGLEWLDGDRFQLLHPPRTILWKQNFVRIFDASEKDYALVQFLCSVRKRGEIKIELKDSEELIGVIRKIRISPTLRLEISSSHLLEWSSVKKIFQGTYLCYESSSCFFSLPVL